MTVLESVPFGQRKLCLLLAILCGVFQSSWLHHCTAFIPTESFSKTKCSRIDRSFRSHSSLPLALFTTLRGGDTQQIPIDEKEEIETGNDLKTVKLLTTSAIFNCGTEEGLEALSVLNELCERRLAFDFSLEQENDEDSTNDNGERVISKLSKFLPEKTTNDFLGSVQILEKEGLMSTNPDSVDGLPSLHLNLVSNGKPLFASPVDGDDDDDEEEIFFRNQIHNLYELVRPYVYDKILPEADRLLQSSSKASGRKLRVSDVFLRRYGEDICGSVTRKGISIHYDVYSRITAVVALDEVAASGNNGLFTLQVDQETGETSNHKALRRFFPLTTGDCVLHTWDILHGVDVEVGLDRTSLIVWFDEVEDDSDSEDTASELVSPWLSLEHQGSSSKTTLEDGNDVRQFVLASALASVSETDVTSTNVLYLRSASKGNTFALTRMGSICEEGAIGSLREDAKQVLDDLRPFGNLPEILKDMLSNMRDSDTELACRFWLEASLTGNPLAQKSLADEIMVVASQSENEQQRLLAATLFALASQQEGEVSDSLMRVIEFDASARQVESQEDFLASPVVQTASAALGGL